MLPHAAESCVSWETLGPVTHTKSADTLPRSRADVPHCKRSTQRCHGHGKTSAVFHPLTVHRQTVQKSVWVFNSDKLQQKWDSQFREGEQWTRGTVEPVRGHKDGAEVSWPGGGEVSRGSGGRGCHPLLIDWEGMVRTGWDGMGWGRTRWNGRDEMERTGQYGDGMGCDGTGREWIGRD